MQFGFVSAIVPELTLEQIFAMTADSGYNAVEVMCWPTGKAERRYAGVTHIDVTGFDTAKADAIKALSAKYGVSITALGYYPNVLSPDADEAERCIAHLRQVITAAGILGVGANTFIGRAPAKSIDENWPQFQKVWPDLIRHAESQNVRVGIENCPMYFSKDEWPSGKNLAVSPAIWRRMFAEIPSENFGLNYDPSHLVWQQMDYVKPLREFAPKLFHVHAKDVRVDRERLDDVGILATPLEYHLPKLPGLGAIDWGRFFSILGDVGYDGPVCVEVEDRAYEATLESRKTALRQSSRFLRNYIP
jgi:sugar phosphate isomerase/epimerase